MSQTPKTTDNDKNHPWSMQISIRYLDESVCKADLWLGNSHYGFEFDDSPFDLITRSLSDLVNEVPESNFILRDEFQPFLWIIKQNASQKHLLEVEIRSHNPSLDPNNLSKEYQTIAQFTVARDFFIESFLIELEKIATQLSYPRFAKNRDSGTFPWQTIAEIRQNHRRWKKTQRQG
ncbi:hypothetical protein Rhal01_01299 [Rubritalea halochordaticola]|uniref:Uncharacterized protein n=1 Tax=Rubritalea halochordaticola TaxID=714537 RepID=A0ABP9V3B4_9BACT